MNARTHSLWNRLATADEVTGEWDVHHLWVHSFARARAPLVKLADIRRDHRGAPLARRVLRNPRPLPTYWWNHSNVGDAMSADIVSAVSGASAVFVPVATAGKFLALGSILHCTQPGDTVWGSGSMRDERVDLRAVTVLALRGPRSRALVEGDAPEVYGDPAMLLPAIYRPRTLPSVSVGFVPHYADLPFIGDHDPGVRVIDVRTRDWRTVVDQISSCDVVVSSSLHGVVVAEAYGVPAVWLQMSDRVHGGGFKFADYYEGTDRECPEPARWNDGLARAAERALPVPTLNPGPLWNALADHVTPSAG